MREALHRQRQNFEAWRQVSEVLLTACPEDLLSGERRQTVIFELLQELLCKVGLIFVCFLLQHVGVFTPSVAWRREMWKEEALDDLLSKDKRGPSSDQPWNCLKGNVGETSERWGGTHMGFSDHIYTILN